MSQKNENTLDFRIDLLFQGLDQFHFLNNLFLDVLGIFLKLYEMFSVF